MNWTNKATAIVNSYLENKDDLQTSPEDLRSFVETELINADGLAADLLQPVLDSVDWRQLHAYDLGIHNALDTGVYDQQLHDRLRDEYPAAGSAFKAGYDRGMTIYCNANGLED